MSIAPKCTCGKYVRFCGTGCPHTFKPEELAHRSEAMTPQEKAKELFDKYYKIAKETNSCFDICERIEECDHTGHGCYLWMVHAKQCALIAIEEILNIEGNYLINTSYWQQVKAEIEKL